MAIKLLEGKGDRYLETEIVSRNWFTIYRIAELLDTISHEQIGTEVNCITIVILDSN